MTKDKIKLGIIGVGQIGKSHIKEYQAIPDAEILAIADINIDEANKVAKEYKIPQVFNDFHKILENKEIEAVDVCLHNNLHMPVTVAALNAGKNVYCEKPMAGSYRDALVMYETAKKMNLKLSIQLNTLFRNETKAAKILIDKGYLGKIYHARSTGFRRRGRPFVDGYGSAQFVQKGISSGGALYDMGVYHIANMLYLMGNPKVQRITGNIYQEVPMDPAREKTSGYNVEELGVGFVCFENKISLDIIEAWAIYLDGFEGSSIVGNKGGIRLTPFGFYSNIDDLDIKSTFNLDVANYRWHILHEDINAYDRPQNHWIAALQNRVQLLPTAELALNTMLISEGIYLSDKLGREVTSEEVAENSKSTAVKL